MKTAFITGATAGIGKATARKLVSAGWTVIGTGRRAEAAPIPEVAPVIRIVLLIMLPRIDRGSTGTPSASRRFGHRRGAPAG